MSVHKYKGIHPWSNRHREVTDLIIRGMKNNWIIEKEWLRGKDKKIKGIVSSFCEQTVNQNWKITDRIFNCMEVVSKPEYDKITSYPETTEKSKESRRRSTRIRRESRKKYNLEEDVKDELSDGKIFFD